MRKSLAFIENNLLLLAVLTAALGLLVPSVGISLEAGIGAPSGASAVGRRDEGLQRPSTRLAATGMLRGLIREIRQVT